MQRPLSPFMFPIWYRFQITSALSIVHRLTGIALAIGSILLAGWLVSVAVGGELFAATHSFIASPVGMLLILAIFALRYGVRLYAAQTGGGVGVSANAVADAALVITVGLVCAQRLEIALRATRLLNEARAGPGVSG